MSITIRLDSNALSSLVASDPAFKLELQRCVVAEVVRRMMPNDVPDAIKMTISAQCTDERKKIQDAISDDVTFRAAVDQAIGRLVESYRAGGYGYANQKRLSAETQEMIAQKVREIARAMVDEKVGDVPAIVKSKAEAVFADIDRRISLAVDANISQHIEREVDLRVQDRISAIVNGLSPAS